MKSFDEWWEENYMMVSADRTEAEDIYNIGAQSRQAEIALLQGQVDELKKQNQRLAMRIDSLQGVLQREINLIVELKGNQS